MNITKNLVNIRVITLFLVILTMSCVVFVACMPEQRQHDVVSDSGAKKMTVEVQTNQAGHTIEQENVGQRLKMDNKPGSIKHLYVISPYSGQVLIYSTVKGKVTSSGKRLTPTTVVSDYQSNRYNAFEISIGGSRRYTNEVLQDDGTYGSSDSYIFWWDVAGRYHQHFMTGGQILHISDQPMNVKSVIINMETNIQ